MTTGSILLGAALLLLTALYVARPFLQTPSSSERRSLRLEKLAEKDAVLDEIQRLEFDHDTGKIPADFFTEQRQILVLKAAAVLQELDQSGLNEDDDVDEAIERAVAALRDEPEPASTGPMPAAKSRESDSQARFCSQCGQAVETGDKFCAYCGHQLAKGS